MIHMNQSETDVSALEPSTQPQLKNFKVFSRHVGSWAGKWIRLDAEGKELERFTAVLTKKIVDNQWVQTNAYQFADGRSVTQEFVGKVVGEGVIQIESPEPPFCNYNLIAEEHGEQLIIFWVRDKATERLIGIETINLSDENTCIRTTQGFNAEGEFRGSMMIIEHRIREE